MRCADYVIQWEKLHAALQVDLPTYRRQPRSVAASKATMPATNAARAYDGNSLRPATPSNPAQTRPIIGQQPDMRGRPDQSIHPSYEQPHHWVTDRSTPEVHTFPQGSSIVRNEGYDLQQPDIMGSHGPLLPHTSVLQDENWYSLSFAEAGIEQFAGLEPSTLFQQRWRTFS